MILHKSYKWHVHIITCKNKYISYCILHNKQQKKYTMNINTNSIIYWNNKYVHNFKNVEIKHVKQDT